MKSKVLIGLSLLALGVTSCKKEIEFDQANYDNYVNQAFVVDNIDPYHRWATMGSVHANITVNGDYGKTYNVGIYLENPMSSSAITTLFWGEVESGSTLSTAITCPLSQDFVYVGIFDEAGRRIIMNAPVKNGIVEASYGASSSKNAKRRVTQAEEDAYAKTAEDYLNPEKDPWGNKLTTQKITVDGMKAYGTFTDDDIEAHPTLTDTQRRLVADGKHFRVAAGTTITKVFNVNGQWGVYNDVVVYVEGIVHLNGNTLNGPTVVVANGGEIIIDGNTHCTGAGRFIVLPGGKITGADGKLWDNSNGSFCYNAGLIEFKGILNLNGTDFYNSGTVNVDVLTGTAGNTKFVNFGKITARTNSYSGSAYNQKWVNGCYVHFTETAGLGESVLLSGSRFDIDKNADVVTGSIEMHNQSELKIGNMMKLNGATFTGPSTAGEYAIVKTSKLYATWADAINCSGLVYFDFDPDEIYGKDNNEALNYKKEISKENFQYCAAYGIINNKIKYWVNEDNALNDITIPEGCGGTGFNANGNNGDKNPVGTPLTYMYCFEDNFPDAGDYDFNDAVLTVTPSVNDKVVTLTVSLKAVGATKTLGAAIRLVGINSSDLTSMEVTQPFASPEGQGMGTYNNIDTQETFVPGGFAPNNTSSMVVVLFKDAHWAMNPTQASVGGVQRNFYNTVKRTVNNANAAYVDAPVAIYTLTFNDAEKAKGMLKNEIYDVFIVEPYGSSYWEVHTIPYKTDQVITPMKPDGYAKAYGSITPWAVAVPITATSNFKYPIEWQVIGSKHSGVLGGAYQTAGHAFGEWAEDHTKATDWYEHPTSGLVFE